MLKKKQIIIDNYRSGAQRRLALMVLIAQRQDAGDGLPVNNKWQLNTKNKDIQYLMKRGKIQRIRHSTAPYRNLNTGLKKSGKGQTYLVLSGV